MCISLPYMFGVCEQLYILHIVKFSFKLHLLVQLSCSICGSKWYLCKLHFSLPNLHGEQCGLYIMCHWVLLFPNE